MGGEPYGSESYIDHFVQNGSSAVVDRALLNAESRARKARKIDAVLKDFLKSDLTQLSCLDIGCSGGHITAELARTFGVVVGLDTDAKALAIASRLTQRDNLSFQQGSATELPFPESSFDVVVCNHVYEHIEQQESMFNEIYRVLRPGGVCYLGAGNRFVFIEPHYRLPLLSWPPKLVSNFYLRVAGFQPPYRENHRNYWGLRQLVRRFVLHDYTPRILAQPARFAGGDPSYEKLPTRFIPERLIGIAAPLFPTYAWVLEKNWSGDADE